MLLTKYCAIIVGAFLGFFCATIIVKNAPNLQIVQGPININTTAVKNSALGKIVSFDESNKVLMFDMLNKSSALADTIRIKTIIKDAAIIYNFTTARSAPDGALIESTSRAATTHDISPGTIALIGFISDHEQFIVTSLDIRSDFNL